jgi:hypothetical protein
VGVPVPDPLLRECLGLRNFHAEMFPYQNLRD